LQALADGRAGLAGETFGEQDEVFDGGESVGPDLEATDFKHAVVGGGDAEGVGAGWDADDLTIGREWLIGEGAAKACRRDGLAGVAGLGEDVAARTHILNDGEMERAGIKGLARADIERADATDTEAIG
jgi:hypothetical protein